MFPLLLPGMKPNNWILFHSVALKNLNAKHNPKKKQSVAIGLSNNHMESKPNPLRQYWLIYFLSDKVLQQMREEKGDSGERRTGGAF